MLFNSFNYLIFFPTVVFLYYLLPFRFRWLLLLIASYVFYMSWRMEYIVLILFSTVVDYISAVQIERSESDFRKRMFLYLSLFTNLGLLFSFKYFNFFSDNLSFLYSTFDPNFDVIYLDVILPVGISFYTFQTMAYTIDVYRGQTTVEKHFGRFGTFCDFLSAIGGWSY